MRHYDGRREGRTEGGRRESNSLGRADGEREGGRPPRTAEDDVDNGLNGCGKVDYAQGDVPPVTPQSPSLTHSVRFLRTGGKATQRLTDDLLIQGECLSDLGKISLTKVEHIEEELPSLNLVATGLNGNGPLARL